MQAFVFDLDGTLVDSVYQHVLEWQEALNEVGMELSVEGRLSDPHLGGPPPGPQRGDHGRLSLRVPALMDRCTPAHPAACRALSTTWSVS